MNLSTRQSIFLKLSLFFLFISFTIISIFLRPVFWNVLDLIPPGSPIWGVPIALFAQPLIPIILGALMFYRCTENIKQLLVEELLLEPNINIFSFTLLNHKRKLIVSRIVGFIGVFVLTVVFGSAFSLFSDAIYKAKISYGTARITKEFYQNGIHYSELTDSLAKDASIKTIFENFDITELQSDSGSALYFKPVENANAHYGICIDDDGNIHSYIRDDISTFQECLESRVSGTIDSALSDN